MIAVPSLSPYLFMICTQYAYKHTSCS